VSEIREMVVGFTLLQYGGTMAWGRQAPSADGALLPGGEGHPPLDHWLDLLERCTTLEEAQIVVAKAREELEAWLRRPEPPPQGETLEDLKQRIIREGEGWTPQEVALAMRVTPTLVRNVRSEAERDPQYGRPDGSLAHGVALLNAGLSVRQAAQITGIAKSTLHDAWRSAA
jgi:hypothetical protein